MRSKKLPHAPMDRGSRAVAIRLLGMALVLSACAENGPTDRPSAPVGQLTEEMRLDPYAQDLVPIRGLAVADDGSIAILQPQDGLVRFFAEDGTPLGAFGRQGQGPGEFTSMRGIGWIADTLWVNDLRQSRLTLISPEREFVRSVQVPREAVPTTADADSLPVFSGLFTPLAVTRSAEFLATSERPSAIVGDWDEFSAAVVRISPGGTVRGILHRLSVRDLSLRTAQSSMSRPYANIPSIAGAPDGSAVSVAVASLEGDSLGTFRLTSYAADGEAIFSRRYPYPVTPLPGAVADSLLESIANEMQAMDPGIADAVRRVQPPPVYPPLAEMVIGRDGIHFVRMIDQDDERPYLVIDGEGEVIGTLALPTSARVAAGDRERIWAIEMDEFDVETVVRYRVTY